MIAGLLAHPIALAILLGIAFCAVNAWSGAFSPAGISKRRLWSALGGVALAAVAAAAIASYATPEQARQFGVPEGLRWIAIWHEFIVLAVTILYLGIVGASVVGIPLALFMAHKGMAVAPWYVAASLPISLFIAVPMVSLASGSHPLRDIASFAVGHAWLAFGFAAGARLPWRIIPV